MTKPDSPLGRLLGPLHTSSFLTSFWPARAFHVRVDPRGWPAWLHSELLERPANLDAVYRGRVDVTRGNRAQYRVEGAPVSRWVEDLGLTARLSDMDRYLPGAAAWLRALELELGIPAQSCELNAFLNAPGVGLSAHCDPYEHLLIHVTGTKRIGLYPSPAGSYYSASHSLVYTPTPREAAQRPEGFSDWGRDLPSDAQQIELEPGSVLFMPRGCYHETRGGDEGPSISLVVRMLIPSHADLLLEYLRDYLAQSAAWRAPAAGAWSPDEQARRAQRDALQGLLRATAPRLAELDMEHLLAHARQLPPDGAVSPLARFVRNPSILVQTDVAQGKVCIRSELGLGPSFDAALSSSALGLLAQVACLRAPFSFGELCERFRSWDPPALSMIVRFLQHQAVLIELTVEPFCLARDELQFRPVEAEQVHACAQATLQSSSQEA
jgi:hypothetical protein